MAMDKRREHMRYCRDGPEPAPLESLFYDLPDTVKAEVLRRCPAARVVPEKVFDVIATIAFNRGHERGYELARDMEMD